MRILQAGELNEKINSIFIYKGRQMHLPLTKNTFNYLYETQQNTKKSRKKSCKKSMDFK